uniref:Uncharacterized protein n=1 Tax=Mycena chlorophos TaxID=658473 RepID=A0ABQ0LUZ3_MYCCL|nr:predicted protein [Mycena chlorophos]
MWAGAGRRVAEAGRDGHTAFVINTTFHESNTALESRKRLCCDRNHNRRLRSSRTLRPSVARLSRFLPNRVDVFHFERTWSSGHLGPSSILDPSLRRTQHRTGHALVLREHLRLDTRPQLEVPWPHYAAWGHAAHFWIYFDDFLNSKSCAFCNAFGPCTRISGIRCALSSCPARRSSGSCILGAK